mmetsp:Transcript_1878/g.4178  ORF Transcript_1878/g.4178 Transcript_1878/m.4178 type:complete len:332 (-) Transcript_1878:343-1338(-)
MSAATLECLKECLERQIDELTALAATFPESGAFVLQPSEEDNYEFAKKILQGGSDSGFSVEDIFVLSGTVRLQDVVLGGAPVGLRFTLPKTYPMHAAAAVSVECAGPRDVHEQLSSVVRAAAQSAEGMECLLVVVEALREAASSLPQHNDARLQHAPGEGGSSGIPAASPAHQGPSSGQGDRCPAAGSSSSSSACLCRTLIWFHHIKSSVKRRVIVEAARQLGLGGYSKPGFPGIIVVEGPRADVEEYVGRIRSLSWQAMQVRGEEVEEGSLGAADAETREPGAGRQGFRGRRFVGSFQELPEEGGMSALGQICREVGLEDLFLTGLKISK